MREPYRPPENVSGLVGLPNVRRRRRAFHVSSILQYPVAHRQMVLMAGHGGSRTVRRAFKRKWDDSERSIAAVRYAMVAPNRGTDH